MTIILTMESQLPYRVVQSTLYSDLYYTVHTHQVRSPRKVHSEREDMKDGEFREREKEQVARVVFVRTLTSERIKPSLVHTVEGGVSGVQLDGVQLGIPDGLTSTRSSISIRESSQRPLVQKVGSSGSSHTRLTSQTESIGISNVRPGVSASLINIAVAASHNSVSVALLHPGGDGVGVAESSVSKLISSTVLASGDSGGRSNNSALSHNRGDSGLGDDRGGGSDNRGNGGLGDDRGGGSDNRGNGSLGDDRGGRESQVVAGGHVGGQDGTTIGVGSLAHGVRGGVRLDVGDTGGVTERDGGISHGAGQHGRESDKRSHASRFALLNGVPM